MHLDYPVQTYAMPAPWGGIALSVRDGQLAGVRPLLTAVAEPAGAPEAVAELMAALEAVLAAPQATSAQTARRLFALEAFTRLPAFTRRVLEVAAALEPGHWTSYGEVARAAGRPWAARAVGQALAHNPFPILIGCHRVCGNAEREAFDILRPGSLRPHAFLGEERLAPVAQWLRLADLSL